MSIAYFFACCSNGLLNRLQIFNCKYCLTVLSRLIALHCLNKVDQRSGKNIKYILS